MKGGVEAMNTFWMVLAGVIVGITGKILFTRAPAPPAVSIPIPDATDVSAAPVTPDCVPRATENRTLRIAVFVRPFS